MLGRTTREPEHFEALERVAAWTRKRFKLVEDAVVLVTELTCSIPGCPPLETAVAFWTADQTRHQFKLLRPVADVTYDDLAWLIGSLANHDGGAWDCC